MKYLTIYFVGIKGVGMASLAVIAKEAGCTVMGSDVADIFITDKILHAKNIPIFEGFTEKNLDHITDTYGNTLVITTGAHNGLSNVESLEAKKRGIRVVTHGEAVGIFMDGAIFEKKQKGISVAGTHGKTTVTALLATVLSLLGNDPTYTVGTSEIFPVGAGGHFGRGEYFIAEADEYASDISHDLTPRFCYQNPYALIINNIDFDHPDFYKDIRQVREAFSKLIDRVDENGIIIANGDDENVRAVMSGKKRSWISFGEKQGNDYMVRILQSGIQTIFEVVEYGKNLGEFRLSVPGMHNAQNALAVISLLRKLGFSAEAIKEVLYRFKGTKRRSEYVGKTSKGAIIIDDYAHHPAEVKTTLRGLSNAYRDREVICIFQPHMYSRTRALLDDFLNAFDSASILFFMKVFTSARENIKDDSIYAEIEKKMEAKTQVFFPESNDFVLEYIKNNLNSEKYLLVTMGAGDVYKISEKLKRI